MLQILHLAKRADNAIVELVGRAFLPKGLVMIISTKGRYALRVMVDLAQHYDQGYVPLREVAERQGISPKYLEAIVSILHKEGLVKGLRGKGGGYRLSCDIATCTVGDVLKLTEGSLAPVACLDCGQAGCERADTCPTLPMWEKLDKMVEDYFNGITIADLVENKG